MKIRYGLVLALMIGLGLGGCASGGGGGGAPAGGGVPAGGGFAAGQNPRDTDNTRLAEDQLDIGDAATAPAEQRAAYEAALAAAEAGIAEDPTNPLAHRLAALAAMGVEDYQAAGGHFDRAAELRPLYEFEDQGIRERAWITLYQEAAPLVSQGAYEEAAQMFEDANAMYSGRPEAFVTLGQIYGQLDETDRALQSLDQAVAVVETRSAEVDSATAAAWQSQAALVPALRGQILSAAERYDEAAGLYRQMLMDDPNDLEASRNLAATLMRMDDEAGAFEVYDDLLTRPGLTFEDYYGIAVGFYQGQAYGRAAEAFGATAERNRMDRDALEFWARSLQIDSAYADIPPVAERWSELDPANQNALIIMAQAENANGNSAAAGALIARIEALQVTMDQLQITRYSDGGARVTGSVANKTLAQGSQVTFRFTFYTESGDPMGTVTETMSVGGEGMSDLLQLEFDSMESVGGYGYEVIVG